MARERVLEILEFCRQYALTYDHKENCPVLTMETRRRWDQRHKERLLSRIQKSFDCLTWRQKKIVVLFYLEGLPWDQISQQVCYSPRQCQYICQCAVDRLANS